jgi:hypothetical protein
MITIITKTETKPFPKLMKGKRTGRMFFFTEPEKGLVIENGYWLEDWDMKLFEDYNEEVTIKNK